MRLRLRSTFLLAALAAAPAALGLWAATPEFAAGTALTLRPLSETGAALRLAAAIEDAPLFDAQRLSLPDEPLGGILRSDVLLLLALPPDDGAAKAAEAAAEGAVPAPAGMILVLRSRPLPSALGDQLRVRALPEA